MKRLLVIAAVLLAASCQQPPSTAVGGDPSGEDGGVIDAAEPTRTPGVRFAPSHEAAQADEFQATFGLLAQRDIIVAIDLETAKLPAPGGANVIQFSVLNEQGATQQISWLAVAATAAAPDEVDHPVGHGTLQVMKLSSTDGWLRAYTEIPVAGTTFTRHRLKGTFFGEARIGAGDDAEILSGTFALTNQ